MANERRHHFRSTACTTSSRSGSSCAGQRPSLPTRGSASFHGGVDKDLVKLAGLWFEKITRIEFHPNTIISDNGPQFVSEFWTTRTAAHPAAPFVRPPLLPLLRWQPFIPGFAMSPTGWSTCHLPSAPPRPAVPSRACSLRSSSPFGLRSRTAGVLTPRGSPLRPHRRSVGPVQRAREEAQAVKMVDYTAPLVWREEPCQHWEAPWGAKFYPAFPTLPHLPTTGVFAEPDNGHLPRVPRHVSYLLCEGGNSLVRLSGQGVWMEVNPHGTLRVNTPAPPSSSLGRLGRPKRLKRQEGHMPWPRCEGPTEPTPPSVHASLALRYRPHRRGAASFVSCHCSTLFVRALRCRPS